MNQDAQQRIMGYFIEEARDHLTTIEQGLLSLRESMTDPELINELFRAAHSIKGGSAMLGLSAIQRTAHRMEDFFNIFRSHQGRVPVDQHLETLLLRGFDTLSMLLEELQSPRGLTEEVGSAAMTELEPVFAETESHIYHLLSEGDVAAASPPPPQTESLQTVMTQTVPTLMKEMLELFKRREQPGVRDQLREKADRLAEVGSQHHLPQWQTLIQAVRGAIVDPSNDLRNVALIALRDIKQAQQAALQGHPDGIKASDELLALAQPEATPAPTAAPVMTEAQRRILGFFLEEARDHLTTIEQSLLNLKANSGDPDVIEELFRATHSIKGGAAQLGMVPIQRTAHRMEDFFSIFRENPGQIPVDQQLETYLLQGYDTLSRLLDQVQELGYLPEAFGESVWEEIKPVFDQTEVHLEALISGGAPAEPPVTAAPIPLQQVLNQEIPRLLKQMLASFKHPNPTVARDQLQQAIGTLQSYGDTYSLPHWSHLTQTIQTVLTQGDRDLKEIALPLLRDLKQGHHALLSGQEDTIQVSAELLALLPTPEPSLEETDVAAALDTWLSPTDEDLRLFAEQPTQELPIPTPEATETVVDWVTDLETEATAGADLGALFESLSEEEADASLGSSSQGSDDLGQVFAEESSWDLDLSPEEEFELPDLGGLSDVSHDETTEVLPRQQATETEELGDFDMDWLGQELPSEGEDFDPMPLELEDEDEMAFSELFSNAEELAAIEDPSFDTPTGFPLLEAIEESEEASLSQRIGEAKAEGDLVGLFSELADTTETSAADAESVLADEATPIEGELDLESNGSQEADWGSLFDDLGLSGDLEAGEGLASEAESADPFNLDPLAADTEKDNAALFDALFSEPESEPSPPDPTPAPEAATPQTAAAEAQAEEFSFEDLFAAPVVAPAEILPTVAPPAATAPAQQSESEDLLGLENPESESFEQQSASEDLFGLENLESDSFDALFDSLGIEDTGDLSAASEATDRELASEELDLGGFDDLFMEALDTEGEETRGEEDLASGLEMAEEHQAVEELTSDLGTGEEDQELGDLVSWFGSESGDTVLEEEPALDADSSPAAPAEESLETLFGLGETADRSQERDLSGAESPDTLLEDLEGLFGDDNAFSEAGTEMLAAEGEEFLEDLFGSETVDPLPFSEPAQTESSDRATEAGFDPLEALFGQESDESALSLESSSSQAFSQMDTDQDGQIDLDELSQFLQEDPAEEAKRSEPTGSAHDSSDLDLELDSLFGDDFGSTTPEVSASSSQPVSTTSEGGALEDLEDLAALFDQGQDQSTSGVASTAPSAAASAPAPAQLQLGNSFDDELDAILGDISLDMESSAATAAVTPAPVHHAAAATPSAPAPLVTQPPAAQPAVARSSAPTSRRPAPFSNQTMRVEVRHLDQINNLVGELVVNRNSMEQNQGRLRQFLDGLLVRVQQLSELGQRMQDQYDRSLLETALLASRGEPNLASAIVSGVRTSGSGHSSGQSFDALEMDRFTAFHALSQEIIELIVRVRESSSDIQFGIDEAEQITRQFRQVTTQLQEGLNRARMVPFSQIADRLPRAIRDLSIKTGKQAALVVDGRETSIDKAILEELYDPMTHLVNNALVHGIESPDDRRRSGKPAEGKITIKAFYQGNQSIIVVSDDGGGINVDKVRQKATGLGLLPADADEDEVFNVLFHPGFSGRSAEEVDDLAGRGVGLDVVRRNINELRGSIQVDSERHKGTTFTIRLPLTLSISKAMVCVSDKALVAFPLDGVEEMLDVPQDEIEMDEVGRPTLPWRDTRLHYQPLSDLLRYSRLHSRSRTEVYSITQDEGIVPIVVLQSAGQYVALQVDSFVEEQEIVIKQLRGPTPKPPGIAGATVLGNGRVLPIADIIELVDLAQGRTRRDMSKIWMDRDIDTPELEKEHQTTVLIVDDSITVRELLSMTFNKVGYRVEQARDGQDAWEKLRGGLPCDLIFCDIEMPRMDGLELLSRLKEDETLNTKPIAMLTSRGAERHRQTARELGATAYFTKPYLEEELLNAAGRMLEGERLLT